MTTLERIDSRIARLEVRLDELRALRAELLAAEGPPVPGPGAVDFDRYERPHGPLPLAGQGPLGPQVYRDDKEHVAPGERHGGSPPEPPPVKPKRGRPPKGAAAGKGEAGDRALAVARSLAALGPQTTEQLAAEIGVSVPTVRPLMTGHPWFAREHRLRPWELTEAGRAALVGAS